MSARKSDMYLVGMPLPSENALRIKVGLMPHRKLVCKADSDNSDDDTTWKPYMGKSTKPNMQSSFIGSIQEVTVSNFCS